MAKYQPGWELLGQTVRRRRERLGITQEDVAKAGGPSVATLRLIENAQADPRSKTLFSLDSTLGWPKETAVNLVEGKIPASSSFKDFDEFVDDAIDWVSATTREQYDVPVTTRPLGLTGDILHPVDNPGLQIKRPPIVGSGVGSLGGLTATARGYRGPIPEATVTRLAVYRRVLSAMDKQGAVTVSSEGLSAAAGVSLAKLEKDLSYFGSHRSGAGYEVSGLISEIDRTLDVISAVSGSAPIAGQATTGIGRASADTASITDEIIDQLALLTIEQLDFVVAAAHATRKAKRVELQKVFGIPHPSELTESRSALDAPGWEEAQDAWANWEHAEWVYNQKYQHAEWAHHRMTVAEGAHEREPSTTTKIRRDRAVEEYRDAIDSAKLAAEQLESARHAYLVAADLHMKGGEP